MKILKKHLSVLLALTLIFSMILPMSFGVSTFEEKNYVEGQVIIQFDSSLSKEHKAQYKKEIDVKESKKLNNKGMELLKFNKNKSVEEVIEKLSKKKGVKFVEPDYILYASETDPNFDLLWGLENGPSEYGVGAPNVWDDTTGVGITVAVIDSGVDVDHPDLIGQCFSAIAYQDGVKIENYQALSGEDDHGTHVAGTIAATLDNGEGIAGVAPNAKILPIKFLWGGSGDTSDAILAIEYARDNGADLINASWGGGSYSEALETAIADFKKPFVAAAGNDGYNLDYLKRNGSYKYYPHYPSSYTLDNIIAVAALDEDGSLAEYSNYGITHVDIAAPGSDILSTMPGGYGYGSGTSMATPHMSGVVALLMSADKYNNLLDKVYYDDDINGPEINQYIYDNGAIDMDLSITTESRVDAELLINAYNTLAGSSTPQDTDSPTLSDATIIVSTVTDTSLDLSWVNAIDAENLFYEVLQDGILVECGEDLTTVTVDGLTPNTAYRFVVRVLDETGNSALYDEATVTTSPSVEDNTPPKLSDATITASNISDTSVDLSWATATDNITSVENLEYAVLKDGVVIKSGVNITSATITDLAPETTYSFNVSVSDEANNSILYTAVSVTTDAAPEPDTTDPNITDATIIATNVTETSVDLSWLPATDNITSVENLEYDVLKDGIVVKNDVNMTSATITNLTPDTTYSFNVSVSDEAGNSTLYTEIFVTTDAQPIILYPVVTSTDPSDGSRVSPYGTITIDFDDLGLLGSNTLSVSVNGSLVSYSVDGNTIELGMTTARRTRYTIIVSIEDPADTLYSYTFGFRTLNR